MKKTSSRYFIAMTIMSLGAHFSNLSHADSPISPTLEELLNATAPYQNTAGCLDAQALLDAAANAQRSGSTWVDMEIVDRGRPISENIIGSVLRNTILDETPFELYGLRIRQIGCEAFAADSTFPRLKLIEATPLKLVTEAWAQPHTGEQGLYFQFALEIIGLNRFKLTVAMPYVTPNNCGPNRIFHEVQQAINTGIVDFNSEAPFDEPAERLKKYRARWKFFKDPANKPEHDYLNAVYCRAIFGP